LRETVKFRLPGPIITFTLETASRLGATISPFLIDRKRVERIRNLAYGSGSAQRLDVYVPKNSVRGKKIPISFFVHGGGFRFFSKESHAAAAARLAESGRIVFCIDYRLAPKHPFPEGLADAAHAYAWMIENAERFGGDLARISMVGESSGAGLIASLNLYLFEVCPFPASIPRPPLPSLRPKAAVLHCGYYVVSDIERFRGDRRFHPTAQVRIEQIRRYYLPREKDGAAADRALADPLLVFEEMAATGKALPPGFPELFLPVGEKDPVIGDSEKLAKIAAELGQIERMKVYPGVGHSFYALPSGVQAKRCWLDIIQFLERSGA
jgi:acetyl esterase/lipase